MRKILLTGFEPFAGLTTNPSALLLQHFVGRKLGEAEIVTRLLPVSLQAVPDLVRQLIATLEPVGVLGLGVATGSAVLRVERLAVDVADFSVADNDGARPRGSSFAAGGPPAVRATWDAEAVLAALLEAGIPATGSWHAGTHLCNLTLFTFLQELAARPAATPCGFLHLPCTPDQVAGFIKAGRTDPQLAPARQRDLPSMSLELQEAAVAVALATMCGCPPSALR